MSDFDAIKAKFAHLARLRVAKDEAKVAADTAAAAYKEYEAALYQELIDSGMKGRFEVEVEGIGSPKFQRSRSIRGRVIDPRAAREYFAANHMTQYMDEPKFAQARINELAKQHVESGKELPPGIDFYELKGINISGLKTAADANDGGDF